LREPNLRKFLLQITHHRLSNGMCKSCTRHF